jgi:hypothetical protein
MTAIQELKIPLRAFYGNESTEVLCRVLAGCQDGTISYASCCCFIGATTADHIFDSPEWNSTSHYGVAARKPYARDAELAIRMIGIRLSGFAWNHTKSNEAMRRIAAAIIKGILRLRERASRQHGAASDRVSPTQKIFQEVQR